MPDTYAEKTHPVKVGLGRWLLGSLELSLTSNLDRNPPHDIFQGELQTPQTDDDAESGLIEPCFVSTQVERIRWNRIDRFATWVRRREPKLPVVLTGTVHSACGVDSAHIVLLWNHS